MFYLRVFILNTFFGWPNFQSNSSKEAQKIGNGWKKQTVQLQNLAKTGRK
jgi:hypothetical protein